MTETQQAIENKAPVIEGEIITQSSPQMALVPRERASVLLAPVMDIQIAKRRLAEFQEFVKDYLIEEEDFGTIPGTKKPTLYKPGADKLCELYGLSDDYQILTQVENFAAEPPLFDYTIKCVLRSRRDDSLVSTGLGSCNSHEGKYKYRDLKRKCPVCHQETVIKGKEQYGGGWICWKKAGTSDGCGMKWPDGSKEIEDQVAGKTLNDDVPTLKNTILKMAKKRAKIDATLAATRSSGIFTQDMEDITPNGNGESEGSVRAATAVATRKIADYHARQQAQVSGKSIELTAEMSGDIPIWVFADSPQLAVLLERGAGEFTVRSTGRKARIMPRDDDESMAKLQQLAKAQGMSVVLNDDDAERSPTIPVTPKTPDSPAAALVPDGVASGPLIEHVGEIAQGKKARFFSVRWDNEVWNCFHCDWQPFLKKCEGKPAIFLTSSNGKYRNLEGISSVNGEAWHENAPAIDRSKQ